MKKHPHLGYKNIFSDIRGHPGRHHKNEDCTKDS